MEISKDVPFRNPKETDELGNDKTAFGYQPQIERVNEPAQVRKGDGCGTHAVLMACVALLLALGV